MGKCHRGAASQFHAQESYVLSLRELLMPLQSLLCAEVSARLVGGQGTCGEENGAVRKVGRLGAHAMPRGPPLSSWQPPVLGRTVSWLGWLWAARRTPSHWVTDVGLLEYGEVMNIQQVKEAVFNNKMIELQPPCSLFLYSFLVL